jgi:hypothetical protein
MLMALSTTERDVLIVDGLRLVLIMVLQFDGSREWLGYVHIHIDACVRCIASFLSGL